MPTISATEARAKLYRLMDFAAESHEPVVITGKRSRAVLASCPASFWYFRVCHARQCKAWPAGNIGRIAKGRNAADGRHMTCDRGHRSVILRLMEH